MRARIIVTLAAVACSLAAALRLAPGASGARGFPVPPPGDSFGDSILCCDINEDGRQDLVVSATTASPGGRIGAGSVFVFYGGGGPVARLDGEEAGSAFGDSLACCDLNGDGEQDLLVGATFGRPEGLTGAGYLIIFYGDDLMPVGRLNGSTEGENFGDRIVCCRFAGSGDVTFVGSTFDSGIGGPKPGFVSYFGLGGQQLGRLQDGMPGDGYGNVIACGDMDGDGEPEVAIGAPRNSPRGRPQAGSVFVYRRAGGAVRTQAENLQFDLVARLDGQAPGDEFGGAVAMCRIPAVNRSQLIVGAPGARGRGAISAYRMERGGRLRQAMTRDGETRGDQFGDAVASCAPLRRLAAAIVAGAPGHQGGLGRAYLLNPRGEPLLTLPAPRGAGQFGEEVACCDLDGDGLDEILVGAMGFPGSSGRVFAFSARTGRLFRTLVAPP